MTCVINCKGWTPMHVACGLGSLKVAKILVSASADIEATTNDGSNIPLNVAAEYGHEDIVHLLLETSANLHTIGSLGNTALHLAAYYGHHSVVKTLLISGADITARANDGQIALHRAARQDHVSVRYYWMREPRQRKATPKAGRLYTWLPIQVRRRLAKC